MLLFPGTFPKFHKVRSRKEQLFCSRRKAFHRNCSTATVMALKHFQMNSNNISLHSSTALLLRVAYQGVPGANSEAAALKAYPHSHTVPFPKFEDAIKAAEIGLVDEAVIPIENTIGGSIHFNYDMLLQHRVHIVGETHLIVNHCLVALPSVSLHQLNSVFSHPQALVQCENSLKKLGVTAIPADNTALAAQIVASEGVRENAAIASARAAEIYGLHILAKNFQDRSHNVTRFLKLARKPIIATNEIGYKTSIVFSLRGGPGELHKALSVFASSGVNLSKIESRPEGKQAARVVNGFKSGNSMCFNSLFFIDFEASVQDPRAQYALAHLQELARSVRILGCYPMDNTAL